MTFLIIFNNFYTLRNGKCIEIYLIGKFDYIIVLITFQNMYVRQLNKYTIYKNQISFDYLIGSDITSFVIDLKIKYCQIIKKKGY